MNKTPSQWATQLRRATPDYGSVTIGHEAAMEVADYLGALNDIHQLLNQREWKVEFLEAIAETLANVGLVPDEPQEYSVIHATHRCEDLIPAFISELEKHDKQAADDYDALRMESVRDNGSEWYDTTEAAGLLYSLFHDLDRHAEDGFYFGAHPGDGSDFGFWKNEDES